VTGNLKSRELHEGQEEHFFYDTGGLNRLTGTGPDENTVSEYYIFADNGNIEYKEGVGDYIYHPQKRNAVSQIDFEGGVDESGLLEISGLQSIMYNHFNSASEIKNLDDDLELLLEYGPDEQRRRAIYTEDGDPLKTRIYAGSYEKQTDNNTNETLEVHYISAGGMLVAMYVIDSTDESEEGPGKMYYPHQDHLGSIIHISDDEGELFYTQSFDPWGRTRNADDLSYDDIEPRPDWLWRGYTGHEHLDEFGLINMNGRLYDPVVGRMLSPDNYVQAPDFSQSYNRYSYVWNNPLKYTDPSGEFVFIMPHISFSSTGQLDIGVSVGVGFPSGLSAQVTVGHSYGNGGNTYATLSVSGATAYAGYSSQGGWMAGVGVGIGPGLGGFTSNATSAGIHWSQKGGVTANLSMFSYNQYGGFNAHLSAGYSHGFEVEVDGNRTPAESYWNDAPWNGATACAGCKNPPDGSGMDRDVLGDGIKNQVPGRMSDIQIGLGVVGSGIGTMEQAYRYDNQQFKYARNGFSANQLTEMNRANSIKMARFFQNLGTTASALSLGHSFYQSYSGNESWHSFAYDVAMVGIVAPIPYVGPPAAMLGTYYKPEIMHALSRGAPDVSPLSNGPLYCFVEETPVMQNGNYKMIGDLEQADIVMSYNFETDSVELNPVIYVNRQWSDDVYQLITNTDTILVTGEHPFFVKTKNWVKAKDIEAGDGLMTLSSHSVVVSEIDKLNERKLVYNIEVAGTNNFYVGKGKILVHNKSFNTFLLNIKDLNNQLQNLKGYE